jgi:hypothetical protein
MLPIETVISLYKQIQADADCLIDYKVKHNSSRQSSDSVVSPNDQNSSGKEAQKYNVSEDLT